MYLVFKYKKKYLVPSSGLLLSDHVMNSNAKIVVTELLLLAGSVRKCVTMF